MIYFCSQLLQKIEQIPWIHAIVSSRIFGIVLLVIAICLLYFFGWLWWYQIQMRGWKLDLKSAVSRGERESLYAQRRVMRLYAIPFFILVPMDAVTTWERKRRKKKNGSASHGRHSMHRSGHHDSHEHYYNGHHHHHHHHGGSS